MSKRDKDLMLGKARCGVANVTVETSALCPLIICERAILKVADACKESEQQRLIQLTDIGIQGYTVFGTLW